MWFLFSVLVFFIFCKIWLSMVYFKMLDESCDFLSKDEKYFLDYFIILILEIYDIRLHEKIMCTFQTYT